jgi:hypothetical protein
VALAGWEKGAAGVGEVVGGFGGCYEGQGGCAAREVEVGLPGNVLTDRADFDSCTGFERSCFGCTTTLRA